MPVTLSFNRGHLSRYGSEVVVSVGGNSGYIRRIHDLWFLFTFVFIHVYLNVLFFFFFFFFLWRLLRFLFEILFNQLFRLFFNLAGISLIKKVWISW